MQNPIKVSKLIPLPHHGHSLTVQIDFISLEIQFKVVIALPVSNFYLGLKTTSLWMLERKQASLQVGQTELNAMADA